MSSTLMHPGERANAAPEADAGTEERHPFLAALGDRVRSLRARRGMTRKAVALAAEALGALTAPSRAVEWPDAAAARAAAAAA